MTEDKKTRKGLFARLLNWISRGVKQAEKKGAGVCRS